MGCVQTKKKDDNELIKCNIPTVENHNDNIIEITTNKNNNEINNKIIESKEIKENKENKEIKEYKDYKDIINQRKSEKQHYYNILSLNKVNKTSLIKEKKPKKKVHFPHKSYNNFKHLNLSRLHSHETKVKTNENKTNIVKPKIVKAILSESDKIALEKSLQNHFLFKNKNPKIISQIIDSLDLITLKEGTTLFKKGDKGNYFYIVKEGKLELITEYGSKLLFQDNIFGELALIENKKRTATVICIENCKLYLLNGKIFREIVSKINESELKERLIFLKATSLFNNLDNNHLNSLAMGMLKCEFNISQTILYEGDIGKSIYIIKEGFVKCFKGEKQIRLLGPKEFFGESSILFNTNRSLSVLVVENIICYQVSENFLIECLGNDFKHVIISSITKEAFGNSKFMKIFNNSIYFDKIFECGKIIVHQNQDILIDHNKSIKRKIYVLLTGNLINGKTGEILASRNQLFENLLIKNNHSLDYNIICQNECRMIEFDWEEIISKLNLKIEKKKILSFFNRIYQLKKISLFHETSESKLIEICMMMKKEKFKKGETVFSEGEMGEKLYLIKKGKVKVFKDLKFIRELCEGNCFGEVSLLINEPRSATIIAESDLSLFSLNKDDLNSIIDKRMLDYLTKKISLQDNFNLTLNDLFFCKILGKGKFGNVSLVHNNKNFFAIKAVNKKSADKKKILIKYFIQERNILLKLEHPFIMKLVKTFKSESFIFFLLEYISGRCLSKYLSFRQKKQLKNIEETKFYISTLLLVIDYLNLNRICHRDIKPDNIIINENGYLKLIDFGTSIQLKDFTNTITGTPHYISPEILLGKGYGFSCDYWSIGIIAYEIYFGFYPFGNNAKDPIDVYRDVMKKDLYIKNADPNITQLILGLLKKKVAYRICSLEKAKKLNLFKNFNWDDLIELKLSPPYIPKTMILKDFNDYNGKYIDYVKNQLESKIDNNDSLISSYDEDDKKNEFDGHWDDIF